ncbi:MAG: hypothetical protein FWC16_04785 [Defluviitaleaceae bacterium]|nr:hypothetical protein [Defluviitaleaceae bacterium]MCL2274223.1 hypothetical protein [Defluviitaleaceae bacterium]
MGKQLSRKNADKSLNAIKDFYFACSKKNVFKTRVVAEEKECVLYDGKLRVILSLEHNFYEVNIEWEDSGLTRDGFRKLGLFGVYRSDYVKMDYDSSTLNIGNSKIVVKIYKK